MSFVVAYDVTLGSAVANGGTVTLPYPPGTNQASFTGANAAPDTGVAVLNGNDFFREGTAIEIAYGASSITVTNNTGVLWPDRAKLQMQYGRAGADRPDFVPGPDIAPLEDLSGGAALATLPAIGASYAQTEVRNSFASLNAQVNRVVNALRAQGLVQGVPAAITPPEPAPSTAFTAVAANGWQATYPSPPTFDPVGAPITLAVTRAGHDATGAAASITDNVVVNGRLRLPSPDYNTLTADTVVLNRFVHQGDILPAGVTNNSTRAYPPPQTLWLQPDFFPITEATFTVDLLVQHVYAQNGRPVAAVDIIASDGINPARTVRVTALTFQSWATTGLGVDAFRATFTSADFAEATAITINAIIYPWRGPSYNLATQGLAAPNMKNTTLTGYRVTPVYAYVQVGGSGTPTASTDPAVAAANPYATVLAALTGIAAATGRSECGGGVVRFPNTTWDYDKTVLTGVALTTACVTFESIDPANKATTIIQNTVNTVGSTNLPNRVIVRNMTLRKIGDANALFRGWNTSERTYILQNCDFDLNGQTLRNYWINHFGRLWVIDCRDINGGTGVMQANSTDVKNCVAIGSDLGGNCAISRVACKAAAVAISDRANVSLGFAYGMHVNCFISGNSGSGFVVDINGSGSGTGTGVAYAMVGNIFERFGGSGGAVQAWADGNTSEVRNFIFVNNTLPGADDATRLNRLYNDILTATQHKDMVLEFNVFGRSASKTDVFTYLDNANNPAAAACIGNWPTAMGVQHSHNALVEGSVPTGGLVFQGAGSWRLELPYPGVQIGDGAGGILAPQWTDDRSITGAGTGNGDYRPLVTSPLIRVPAGRTVSARDQLGKAIPTDGTAFVGALQSA